MFILSIVVLIIFIVCSLFLGSALVIAKRSDKRLNFLWQQFEEQKKTNENQKEV